MRLRRQCYWILTAVLAAANACEAADAPALLWDGEESVADYAKRVNLPATQTLDLGDGVKLELVLIPAGKFIMGTPEPAPVDEDAFDRRIATGFMLLVASGAALLGMLAVVIIRAIRQKRRPQVSLGRLLLVTVVAGGCVLSGLHWRQSVQRLKIAKSEFQTARMRFHSANSDEKPAHLVTLTQPFYIGKFTVTQAQFLAMTGANPSRCKGKENPVDQIYWNEAQDFCKTLAERTKRAVRLPTEAEWEYSCRAGTQTKYYSGDTEADLLRVGWCAVNTPGTSHPVGQKEPNAFGLYDMHGNVWQLCQDWYDEDYYRKSGNENPIGPLKGVVHSLRGGAFYYPPEHCRSANRCGYLPGNLSHFVGFRIVVESKLLKP